MSDDTQPIPKSPTGIRGLDTILDGGLPTGRNTVVVGGPGSGKTVLAVEFLYRGALAGEPGVLLSFEERAEDLRANATAMGLHLDREEEGGRIGIVEGRTPYQAVRAGAFDTRGMLAILGDRVRKVGARRVALDGVDVLMQILGDPDRERTELHLLLEWLQEHGLTSVLTVKTRRSGIPQYPFLDYLADCALLLDQRMEGQVRTRRLNVIKYRGSDFLSNEHPFTITGRGLAFLPVSSYTLPDRAADVRLSSGSEALDRALGGGYFQGACVLVAGPTGVGKTTLAATFARDACARGERVLYVTLDEAADTLVRQMAGAGIDLRPAADAGRIEFLASMPESAGVERHLLRIFDGLERLEPRHLVIDAVSAVQRMGSPQGAFDYLVRTIIESKRRGITCFLTSQSDQSEPLGGIGTLGVSSLVDTIVTLHYVESAVGVSRRLLVLKSRGTAHSMEFHRVVLTGRGVGLETGTGLPGESDR